MSHAPSPIVSASTAGPQASLEDLAEAFRRGIPVRSRRFRAPKTFSGKDAVLWLLRHRYAWDERSACAVAEKIRAAGAFVVCGPHDSPEPMFRPDDTALYRINSLPYTPKDRRTAQDAFPTSRSRAYKQISQHVIAAEPPRKGSPCTVIDTDIQFVSSSSDTDSRPGSSTTPASTNTSSLSPTGSDILQLQHAEEWNKDHPTPAGFRDSFSEVGDDHDYASFGPGRPRHITSANSQSGLYLGRTFSEEGEDDDDDDHNDDHKLPVDTDRFEPQAPDDRTPSLVHHTLSTRPTSLSNRSKPDRLGALRPVGVEVEGNRKSNIGKKVADQHGPESDDVKRLSLSLRPIMRSSVDMFRLRTGIGSQKAPVTPSSTLGTTDAFEGSPGMTNPLLHRPSGLLSGGASTNRRTRSNTRANRGTFSVDLHLRKMKYLEAAGRMPSGTGADGIRSNLEQVVSVGGVPKHTVRFMDQVMLIDHVEIMYPD